MTSWPPAKCKPGEHRWQNGQCVRCGLPHQSVHGEHKVAVLATVTSAVYRIVEFLVEAGHADVAQKVADEFLEPAEARGATKP